MPRSQVSGDAIRIKNLLKKSRKKQLAYSELKSKLNEKDETTSWTSARLDAAWVYMAARPQYGHVTRVKGGNGFKIRTNEKTATGTGFYRDIIRVLEGSASNIEEIFNPKGNSPVREVADVHAGRTGKGRWSRPDVFLFIKTKATLSRAKEIHSFEFQTAGKATPANVAQAYVSGRGAQYTWLLFDAKDRPTRKADRLANPEWQAVEALSIKLGVGLMSYRYLSRAHSWRVLISPKKLPVDRKMRDSLLDLVRTDN